MDYSLPHIKVTITLGYVNKMLLWHWWTDKTDTEIQQYS